MSNLGTPVDPVKINTLESQLSSLTEDNAKQEEAITKLKIQLGSAATDDDVQLINDKISLKQQKITINENQIHTLVSQIGVLQDGTQNLAEMQSTLNQIQQDLNMHKHQLDDLRANGGSVSDIQQQVDIIKDETQIISDVRKSLYALQTDESGAANCIRDGGLWMKPTSTTTHTGKGLPGGKPMDWYMDLELWGDVPWHRRSQINTVDGCAQLCMDTIGCVGAEFSGLCTLHKKRIPINELEDVDNSTYISTDPVCKRGYN